MNSSTVRRSTRLLNAVLQLHKGGYQNLAIYPGLSPNGLHWRCALIPFQELVIDGGKIKLLESESLEAASHSSGEAGNQYFGWDDCQSDNARELAKKILSRFPRLLSACRGINNEYSGWLVSSVGHAEAGHLPIHFSDHGAESNRDLIGSMSNNPPPLQSLCRIGGKQCLFSRARHLKADDDWHTAYIRLIDSWRSASIRRLPAYPIESGDVFEIGAYWEGAIWYIQEILGICNIPDFLNELKATSSSSERWATFFAVWDSEGQLVYLVAFLIRHLLNTADKQSLDRTQRCSYEEHLQIFESRYKETGMTFPNPYFGGSNPLHLGIVLSESVSASRLLS